MPAADHTLKKYEILRGHAAYQRLLRGGERVRGDGVTLFFYPRPTSNGEWEH